VGYPVGERVGLFKYMTYGCTDLKQFLFFEQPESTKPEPWNFVDFNIGFRVVGEEVGFPVGEKVGFREVGEGWDFQSAQESVEMSDSKWAQTL
jgi:hypothetical protein